MEKCPPWKQKREQQKLHGDSKRTSNCHQGFRRSIFPHEHFGRLAHNRVKIERGGKYIIDKRLDDNRSVQLVKDSPDILKLSKLNVFVRGDGLDQPQDMHYSSGKRAKIPIQVRTKESQIVRRT